MSLPTRPRLVLVDLDLANSVGEDDRDRLTAFLDAAPAVVISLGYAPDELDLTHHVPRVPVGIASDGVLAWPLGVEYYVRTYGRGAPAELLDHARSRNFVLPELSPAERDACTAELMDAERGGVRGVGSSE